MLGVNSFRDHSRVVNASDSSVVSGCQLCSLETLPAGIALIRPRYFSATLPGYWGSSLLVPLLRGPSHWQDCLGVPTPNQ